MELLRNEKTYNSNKKEQWKFLVIFPKWSTETSICFITSKILAFLSLFSLFICKFQIGFLLTPIRRIFSTTQVIGLGSSHFCFPNFRSTCSSPNLRCVSLILSVSSIVKILWSLMCCYSLFWLWFSDYYVWVYDVCALYWVYDIRSELHISTPNL